MDGTNGFGAWGNRLAMDAAGIITGAPDPTGGEILRDADGEPTGAVRNRGVALFRSAVPPMSACSGDWSMAFNSWPTQATPVCTMPV